MQSAEQTQANRSLPTLRRSSQGKEVKYLQNRLVKLGYVLVVDGIFGIRTETVVKQFQKDYGLKVDGIVGPKTWSALEFQAND